MSNEDAQTNGVFANEVIRSRRGQDIVAGDMVAWIDEHAGLTMDQLGGPGTRDLTSEDQPYPGWEQLGGRTLVDAVAAIGAHLGIPGFRDPKA
ncbi:hypothetical protein [Nocardia arthritidis]|uniref:Uncharacterized protein n=1 Tax=Nocardia arthritidis TaxID=228602 RepID=A0A6G9YGR1_9NOCA|nr:hypothetical protein [Nocardia arthritidis]QIS12153.1 hypothetical protein F5544_21450 [Nocardia arthritidis]